VKSPGRTALRAFFAPRRAGLGCSFIATQADDKIAASHSDIQSKAASNRRWNGRHSPGRATGTVRCGDARDGCYVVERRQLFRSRAPCHTRGAQLVFES